MGRELRRVPTDFDWPLGTVWKGYLPPRSGMSDDELERWYTHERFHPPKGDGYQLWETTSEGSPQTPVFATLEHLAAHCAEHCTTFADFKASKEQWETMLADGLVVHRDGDVMYI